MATATGIGLGSSDEFQEPAVGFLELMYAYSVIRCFNLTFSLGLTGRPYPRTHGSRLLWWSPKAIVRSSLTVSCYFNSSLL